MSQTIIPDTVMDDSVFDEMAIEVSDFCEAQIAFDSGVTI